MKAIKYTGRSIRALIVLLAIGFFVYLLVPARSWRSAAGSLSELNSATRCFVDADEREREVEDLETDSFIDSWIVQTMEAVRDHSKR